MIKRLIKSISFWIILSETFLVIILYIRGFRITYAPELVSDWNAIGATGQWASAVVGVFIPIAIVFIQNQLDKNKKDIGESNLKIYEEIGKLKERYEQIGTQTEDTDEIKRDKLKKKALKIIDIGMMVNTIKISDQMGLSIEETYDLLEEMLRHDRTISAAGQVRKERMNDILWLRKK